MMPFQSRGLSFLHHLWCLCDWRASPPRSAAEIRGSGGALCASEGLSAHRSLYLSMLLLAFSSEKPFWWNSFSWSNTNISEEQILLLWPRGTFSRFVLQKFLSDESESTPLPSWTHKVQENIRFEDRLCLRGSFINFHCYENLSHLGSYFTAFLWNIRRICFFASDWGFVLPPNKRLSASVEVWMQVLKGFHLLWARSDWGLLYPSSPTQPRSLFTLCFTLSAGNTKVAVFHRRSWRAAR